MILVLPYTPYKKEMVLLVNSSPNKTISFFYLMYSCYRRILIAGILSWCGAPPIYPDEISLPSERAYNPVSNPGS